MLHLEFSFDFWPTFLCFHITNSVMETEKNTPDCPSPLPPPTCCTQTNSCTLHCYKLEASFSTPPGCSMLCLAGVDPPQQKAMPPLLWIAFLWSHIRLSGARSDGFYLSGFWSHFRFSPLDYAVPFGWNLGLGYSISASWLHSLKMQLLMSDC